MIMTSAGLWSGLTHSDLLNITRCKSKSDPAVIRPLRLRAGIHHESQQEQDVDILNTLDVRTDNNWIGIVQFRPFHLRFDVDIVNIFLLFKNNICIKSI